MAMALSTETRAADDGTGSTPERIIGAAERMFAERGYKATSVRSITRECGVNLAAIHYHFGSKERLLEEIFARRCGTMNRERMRLLAECKEAPGRPPVLEQIVEAYVRPSLVWPEDDVGARRFMRLRAIIGYEREKLARNLIAKHFNRVSRMFFRRIREVVPHLGESELYWRFHFLLGAHYYTMANPGRIQDLSRGVCDPSDGEAAVRHIVPFLCAGLCAPAVGPTPGPLAQQSPMGPSS